MRRSQTLRIDEPITIQEETDSGTLSYITMDRKTENQVTVQIDIDKKKNPPQETTVTMDGEKVYSLFNTVKIGDTKSEPQINLAEYIPSDAVIRPGNIVLKREFRPDGVRVVLDINYEQQREFFEAMNRNYCNIYGWGWVMIPTTRVYYEDWVQKLTDSIVSFSSSTKIFFWVKVEKQIFVQTHKMFKLRSLILKYLGHNDMFHLYLDRAK